MDRQLAQRMVGAACLLALLVLVVPAILDGNPDSGATITHPTVDDSIDLRTHTIRLDGESREPPVPTSRQAAPTADPVPPEPAASPSEPVVAVPPALEEPAREPVRELAKEPVAMVGAPAEPNQGEGGDWIVQLGSFSQRANADRLAADLKRKGFSASVQGGGGTSGNLFRVRTGPVADRPAAEALTVRLATAGFKGGRVGRK